MSKPIIVEHNIETNEIIEREMNDSEYENYLKLQEEMVVKEVELQNKKAAKAALLDKLGITADEAKLLLS